jgi:hypothetical protein
LNGAEGITVSGSHLFVANEAADTIGEYTTAGATVNAALVSGLNQPFDIAVSGSDLFVVNFAGTVPRMGTIGEYTTSGATVNAALVSLGVGSLSQGIAIGATIPEPSTWAMLLLGFAGLGYAGYRRARADHHQPQRLAWKHG